MLCCCWLRIARICCCCCCHRQCVTLTTIGRRRGSCNMARQGLQLLCCCCRLLQRCNAAELLLLLLQLLSMLPHGSCDLRRMLQTLSGQMLITLPATMTFLTATSCWQLHIAAVPTAIAGRGQHIRIAGRSGCTRIAHLGRLASSCCCLQLQLLLWLLLPLHRTRQRQIYHKAQSQSGTVRFSR